jgi:hypothetical protein
MELITPVAPGLELPIKTYAKDQPPYKPLPCYDSGDEHGMVTMRWKLSWAERFRVLFGGSIWHQVWTFGHKFQPVMLFAHCPLDIEALREEKYAAQLAAASAEAKQEEYSASYGEACRAADEQAAAEKAE